MKEFTKHKRAGSVLPIFFLLFSIIFIPATRAFAQRKSKDAVFLKEGSVVTGSLIQYDSIKGVRILNDCGNWFYSFAEVDSVHLFAKVQRTMLKEKKSGYYNFSSVGLLLGAGTKGYQPLASLTMVNGWQFNQRIFTGIGLGYEFYDWGVLPVFAEIKYLFRPDVVTPFISLKAGYSFPLSNTYEAVNYYEMAGKTYGGVQLNPEVGFSMPVGERNAFVVGLGYNYQELSYQEPEYQWSYYQTKRVYTHFNRISLRVGFIFQ